MPAAGTLDILLKIRSDIAELNTATAGMAALREAALAGVAGLKTEATGMLDALRQNTAEAKGVSDAVAGISKQAADIAKVTAAAKQTSVALAEANHQAEQQTSLAHQAGEAWAHFGEQAKQSLTLGFGVGIADRAIEGVHELVAEFEKGIVEGVHFNAEVENSVNSLASTLRSVQPEIYKTRDAAKSSAKDIFGQVQSFATSSGLNVRSTFEAFSASYATFVDAGFTSTRQQVEAISTIMAAEQSKGIDGTRAFRDALDLLTGRIERIPQVAAELHIIPDEFKAAMANGTQVVYLMEKLSGYREGIADFRNSFTGLSNSVGELVTQLEGAATVPLFEEAKTDLAKIKVLLDSIEAKGFANSIGIRLGGTIDGLKEVKSALQPVLDGLAEYKERLDKLTPEYWLVGKGSGAADAGDLTAQVDANQKLVLGYQQQYAEARSLADLEKVRVAIQADIVKSEDEYYRATGDQKTAALELNTLLQAIANRIDDVKSGAREAAFATGDMKAGLAGSNEELTKMLAKLPSVVAQLQQVADRAALADKLARAANDSARVGVYNDTIASKLQEANEAAKPLGQGGIANSADIRRILTWGANGDPTMAQSGEAGVKSLEQLTKLAADLGTLEDSRNGLERNITTESQKQVEAGKAILAGSKSKTELLNLQTQQISAQTRGDQATADALGKQIQQRQMDASYTEKAADLAKQTGVSMSQLTKEQVAGIWEEVNAEFKHKDAVTASKDAKAAGHAADRGAAAADRQERAEAKFDDEQRAQRVAELRERISEIRGDPSQTLEAKEAQLLPLLTQERAALVENIKYWQQYNAANRGSTDPQVMSRIEQNDRRINQSQKDLRTLNQQPGVNDFGGQFNKAYVGQVDQLGTAAQNAAKAFDTGLNSAIEGTSTALEDVILKTGNWKQALAGAVQSGIKGLLDLGVKTVAHYALLGAQMIANKALGTSLKTQDTAETVTNSATKTAAMGPEAMLSSITTYGVAAAVGVAALLAAMALSHGFEAGGYTGGVAGQVAGVVHGGEFVLNADATAALPRELLHAFNNQRVRVVTGGSGLSAASVAAMSSSGSANSGGGFSPSGRMSAKDARGSGEPVAVHNHFYGTQEAAIKGMKSLKGRHTLIDIMNGQATDMGWT